MKPIILASVSPRRRDLLALLGVAFEVRASQVDESPRRGETAEAFALRLAKAKAQALANSRPEDILIAADTLVILGDIILGKPRDEREAWEMLRALRGRVHRVVSALVVDGERRIELTVETVVRMRGYSDEEIARYIKRGEPFDKAGGYAIQDQEFQPVAEIQGCYANTMGLPVCHLYLALKQLGVRPNHPPEGCQAFTGFSCPLFEQLLSRGREELP